MIQLEDMLSRYSKSELAILADLDPKTVRKALRGDPSVRPRTIVKLARALRTSPQRLQRLIEQRGGLAA